MFWVAWRSACVLGFFFFYLGAVPCICSSNWFFSCYPLFFSASLLCVLPVLILASLVLVFSGYGVSGLGSLRCSLFLALDIRLSSGFLVPMFAVCSS